MVNQKADLHKIWSGEQVRDLSSTKQELTQKTLKKDTFCLAVSLMVHLHVMSCLWIFSLWESCSDWRAWFAELLLLKAPSFHPGCFSSTYIRKPKSRLQVRRSSLPGRDFVCLWVIRNRKLRTVINWTENEKKRQTKNSILCQRKQLFNRGNQTSLLSATH